MKRARTEDYLQELSVSEHRQQSQYQSIVSQIISQFKSCTKITTAFCGLCVCGVEAAKYRPAASQADTSCNDPVVHSETV